MLTDSSEQVRGMRHFCLPAACQCRNFDVTGKNHQWCQLSTKHNITKHMHTQEAHSDKLLIKMMYAYPFENVGENWFDVGDTSLFQTFSHT